MVKTNFDSNARESYLTDRYGKKSNGNGKGNGKGNGNYKKGASKGQVINRKGKSGLNVVKAKETRKGVTKVGYLQSIQALNNQRQRVMKPTQALTQRQYE